MAAFYTRGGLTLTDKEHLVPCFDKLMCPPGNPGGHVWLSELDGLSDAGVVHTDEDRCDLAALDGGGRVERSVRVRAGQDAGAVEVVDLCRECIAGLHVGNHVVRDRVHPAQIVHCCVEDVDKFRTRDGAVHLGSCVIAVGALDQAAVNGVAHVRAVPVRRAVSQRDLAVVRHLMQRGRQLDRLRDRHVCIRAELRAGNAVDQLYLPRALDRVVIPRGRGNVAEREFRGRTRLSDDRKDRENRVNVVDQLRDDSGHSAELRLADRAVNNLVVTAFVILRCRNDIFANGFSLCVTVRRNIHSF